MEKTGPASLDFCQELKSYQLKNRQNKVFELCTKLFYILENKAVNGSVFVSTSYFAI